MDEYVNLIDLNAADIDELTTLPGVGSAMASRILAARPFDSLEDLQRVSGIGPTLLERIAPFVSLSPAEESAEAQAAQEINELEPIEVEIPEPPPIPEGDDYLPEPIAQVEPPPEESEAETAILALPDEEVPMLEEPAEELLAKPDVEIPEGDETAEPEAPAAEEIAFQPDEDTAALAEPAKPISLPPEAPPTPEPGDSAPSRKERSGISAGGAFGISFGCSFITLLLAIVFALGIMTTANNELRNDLSTLARHLNGLDNQVGEIQQDLLGLRERLNNLDSFGRRVEEAESEIERLREDLDEANQHVTEVIQQVEGLEDQVNDLNALTQELQTNSVQFQNFLDGLRELLIGPEEP